MEAELKKQIQFDPLAIENYIELGIYYSETNQNKKAEMLYLKSLEIVTDNSYHFDDANELLAILHYKIGHVYVDLKVYDSAWNHWRKALLFDLDRETRFECFIALATYLYADKFGKNRSQEALDYAVKATEMAIDDFESSRAIHITAQIHSELGNYRESIDFSIKAVKHYRRSNVRDEDFDSIVYKNYFYIANNYVQLNDLKQAKKYYLKCLEMSSGYREEPEFYYTVHRLTAQSFHDTGDLKKAMEHYQKALKFKPDDKSTLNWLAQIKSEMLE